MDIMSDDAHKGSNPADQSNNVGPFDDFTMSTSQDGLSRWWSAVYEGIKRANVVIEKVPAISMDETLKNRYIAEARFLRALYYFDLVRSWGGVPIVTTTNPELNLPRASREEVYDLIKGDLLSAIDNLPEKRSSFHQISEGQQRALQNLCSQKFIYLMMIIQMQLPML